MAFGWPPLNITTSAPSSLRQEKSGSASRPVRKKPSISFTWAKCTAGGMRPSFSGVKAWLSADCTTWALPSRSSPMAETTGGATDPSGTRPTYRRKQTDIVEMSADHKPAKDKESALEGKNDL